MILKIERYTERDCWWLLDDIRKISKAIFDQPFSQDFDGGVDADIFILDYGDNIKDTKTESDSRDVVRLICRLTNGNEFCVLFDTIAYILNDNGKTIEKVVANYKIGTWYEKTVTTK